MDKETYRLLEGYMLSCMGDSAHDKDHIYRVLYYGLDIARTEQGVDGDVLIAACLLHDIGRKEQYDDPALCHAQVGGEKAYRFLLAHGFEEDYARRVQECIRSHRFRADDPPRSLEAKILFDADKLDVTGAMGIARTLLYIGIVSEPLYLLGPDGRVSDGTDGQGPSFFHEYQYKLRKLYAGFHTRRGRELAQKREETAALFYRRLLEEVSEAYGAGPAELEKWLTGGTWATP